MVSNVLDSISALLDYIAKAVALIIVVFAIWFFLATNPEIRVLLYFVALAVAGLVGLYIAIVIHRKYIR